ncbi:SDR family oxidoreductase [Sandaracinus amylolyticus]|uniref:SDR family oxidoreductase n=1 Tax=Sandaracinus amylolyticus TaxID=927083 RepID=UPI00069E7429|nr:SDR family oxidoreductase [Sandaracinus amylolyticus]
MKIVVIGGTGLIGSKLVARLEARGHEAVAAAPNTGVNTMTGEGLAGALEGAQVVVDVSNSPSFEADAAMSFFTTSTRNVLDAEKAAGVRHHVVLSVVGTERLTESGYFRAKRAQEDIISASGVPYTIVHSTQFFEFVKGIADAATVGDTVRLTHARVQPIAADDVAEAMASAALGAPKNGVLEVAGPEQYGLDDLVSKALVARGDARRVARDEDAGYFGAHVEETTLVPGEGALVFATRFDDWLSR